MSITFAAYDQNGNDLAPAGFVQQYEDDPMYGRIRANCNPWELNLANSNFVRLLDLLGLDTTQSGGAWGDGSLQHVQERLTVLLDGLRAMPELDAGTPSECGVGERGAAWIDCGVSPGYFTDRLARLQTIVGAAIAAGGEVTYG